MESNLSRMGDVLVLGPMKLLVAQYIPDKRLSAEIFIIGLFTIVYNLLNFMIVEQKQTPVFFKKLPKVFRDLFFHKTRGKTQLLRVINLVYMYPVLYKGYLAMKVETTSEKLLQKIFLLSTLVGVAFNLFNFIKYLP